MKSYFIFSPIFLQKTFSLTPNSSHSLKNFYPCVLRPRSRSKHLVSVQIFSLFMHSCILDLGFGVFQNFWDFWVFLEIFGLGFMDLMICDHALHFISIITMFHAFRCVLGYCWYVQVGLDLVFTHNAILFLARHMFMHISCIRTLSFFLLCFDVYPLSLG